jgi:DNA-binding CsgD family transcriptional regulator
MDVATIARFWSKVDMSAGADGCWLWTAGKFKHGYGQFWIGGKVRMAHRLSWEIENGPVPSGDHHGTMCVCHRCDVPSCVNPAHLVLGTQLDNVADRNAKRRQARGVVQGRAKLTDARVREIRWLRLGGLSERAIARLFGVAHSTVHNVIAGAAWSHVV